MRKTGLTRRTIVAQANQHRGISQFREEGLQTTPAIHRSWISYGERRYKKAAMLNDKK
jgi:hypothetical protein